MDRLLRIRRTCGGGALVKRAAAGDADPGSQAGRNSSVVAERGGSMIVYLVACGDLSLLATAILIYGAALDSRRQ